MEEVLGGDAQTEESAAADGEGRRGLTGGCVVHVHDAMVHCQRLVRCDTSVDVT